MATPTPTDLSLVLKQYEGFWASLADVSRLPASERRTALSRYASDPELKSVVFGMSRLDAKGQLLYGANLPRPKAKIATDGKTALVDDCQDSTKAGAATKSTMAPVTVGVARNHVVVTMKKVDEIWKVVFVSYTKTPC
ncbi:MAG: hypothetical protein JWM02_1306 [Frankiales bacterium]|nr:hypothetical protein [Frankiales bacterium]